MHPSNAANLIREGAFDGRGDLGNIIGNPLETAHFLARLMFDGTLDKFPGAQGGGRARRRLPALLPDAVRSGLRGCAATRTAPARGCRASISATRCSWTAWCSRTRACGTWAAEVGASQIVYGTDAPFNWPDTLDLILEASYLSDEEKIAIVGGNLMELLRIEA